MIDKMSESDGTVHQKEKEFLVNLINILRWIKERLISLNT
jgi:hypothetical protein